MDYDIEGFKNYLYEEELSQNTIDSYLFGVRKFFGKYSEITKPNLIAFKQELTEDYKPQTVNLRLTAVLKYCEYKDINLKIKHIKEPKKTYVENVITQRQVNCLLEGLKKDNKMRMYYYIILLSKTGMRISEALRVKKKDIIHGSVTMSTKAHMRTIHFPKKLQEEIKPLIDGLQDEDVVMQNAHGKALTDRGFAEELIKSGKKYGVPRNVLHAHAFRHFFAIEFLKRNNNIALLADLLGHGSVNVTQIYLRMSQEQQKDEIDKAVDW